MGTNSPASELSNLMRHLASNETAVSLARILTVDSCLFVILSLQISAGCASPWERTFIAETRCPHRFELVSSQCSSRLCG